MYVLNFKNDSLLSGSSRYVYDSITCENLILKRDSAKVIQTCKDTSLNAPCYNCYELKENSIIFNPVKYGSSSYEYDISADGTFFVSSDRCSKMPVKPGERFGDSISYTLWVAYNEKSGILKVYSAATDTLYPFYKMESLDSMIYDLSTFCGENEKKETLKFFQSLFDEHIKVDISPNPFTEEFSFRFRCEGISYMLMGTEQILTLYDANGNTLKSQLVVKDQTYKFSFPELKSGSTIYYRITWLEYVISGSILKS
jgi:hypothetical protein